MHTEYIDILNTGFGVSIVMSLLHQGERVTILLDSGDNNPLIYNTDIRRIKITEYLKQKKISCIDYAILSHIHKDHIGCFNEILDLGIEIKQLFTNMPSFPDNFEAFKSYSDIPTQYIVFSLQEYQKLIDRINVTVVEDETTHFIGKYKLSLIPISRNNQQRHWEYINLALDLTLSLEERYKHLRNFDSQLNSTTLSIILSKDDETIFYSAGERDLSLLSNCMLNQSVRILHCPHHGDSNYLSNDTLSLLKPDYIVVCADSCNTYNLPSQNLEQKIRPIVPSEICYTETKRSTHKFIRFSLPILEVLYCDNIK